MTKTTDGSKSWFGAAILVAVFGLCVAVTLPMIEFSSGSENLVIATALEIRRQSNWLLPTLDGEPRVAKPPLAAWIAAAAIPQSVLENLSSVLDEERERARFWLGWHGRWPSLLSGCVLLFACASLAKSLGGSQTMWVSVVICASSLMFLKASRSATTDIQLALWVTVTNAFIAQAMAAPRRWMSLAGAGVALGLAMMSKGPVALVQTILPAVLFAVWHWNRRNQGQLIFAALHQGRWLGPTALAAIVMLLIAMPWYLVIHWRHPGVANVWWVELTREGATGAAPGEWYSYIVLLPMLVPWTIFFIIGAVRALADRKQPSDGAGRMMLALLLVIVPILVMSLFRDRKDRYLLPMVAPAAILCADGLIAFCRGAEGRGRRDRILWLLHWAGVLAGAIGLPLAGVFVLRTVDDLPWFSAGFALVLGLAGVAIIAVAMRCGIRSITAMAFGTATIMVLLQTALVWGYRNAREGRSEMKPMADLIWRSYPDAVVYTTNEQKKKLAPSDLSIYLNRPVRWAASPDAVQSPLEKPAILILRQDEDEPEPPPTPAGWSVFAKVPRDKSWWHAFLRNEAEARSPATSAVLRERRRTPMH